MPSSDRSAVAGLLLALGLVVSACTADPGPERSAGSGVGAGSPHRSSPLASPDSAASAAPTAPTTGRPAAAGPEPSDGRPRRASLTIPQLRLRGLPVVPYRGRTDDAPGTAIQDRGRAASPHGPRGGVGPGGIGNYQVTAHRLSSTQAFRHVPRLRRGAMVHVEAGGVRYTYRITRTRWTSFRSPASLRAQRAPVPGRPGSAPTRAMITLSTCATPEDHAAGNYWADRFGNPEHRIDKIGVLVASTPL